MRTGFWRVGDYWLCPRDGMGCDGREKIDSKKQRRIS